MCYLTTAHAIGLRISEGLHREPLPAPNAFLGYRWSYSGFSIALLPRVNNDETSMHCASAGGIMLRVAPQPYAYP
jgi:hypothetical protein